MKLKKWKNNANLIAQQVIQIKSGIAKLVNVNEKVFKKYLEGIAGSSMIECDEIITVMDIISIKKTYTIEANVTSTASINCHNKKVRDCYILQTVLLVIILLLMITIICYYAKQKCIT